MKELKNEILYGKEEKISLDELKKYKVSYLEYKKANYNSVDTIINTNNYINTLISFCEKNNIKYITKDTIHNYILNLDDKQKSTKDKYLKNLRLFFLYLYEYNVIETNFEMFIPKTKYTLKSKIPFYWSEENINKLLNSIQQDSDMGKRDYAILLIIIRLGLRAGDVIRLTLDNIDWNNNQIKFYQHKTTQIQCLPLLLDVKEAIINYIVNTRNNNIENRTLFLDDKNSNSIKNAKKISRILYKYEKKANITLDKSFKNGVHSFRNTLAYNLLINETSINTISQVLGHINPNTAQIYLKIDLEHLRDCVLDWRCL